MATAVISMPSAAKGNTKSVLRVYDQDRFVLNTETVNVCIFQIGDNDFGINQLKTEVIEDYKKVIQKDKSIISVNTADGSEAEIPLVIQRTIKFDTRFLSTSTERWGAIGTTCEQIAGCNVLLILGDQIANPDVTGPNSGYIAPHFSLLEELEAAQCSDECRNHTSDLLQVWHFGIGGPFTPKEPMTNESFVASKLYNRGYSKRRSQRIAAEINSKWQKAKTERWKQVFKMVPEIIHIDPLAPGKKEDLIVQIKKYFGAYNTENAAKKWFKRIYNLQAMRAAQAAEQGLKAVQFESIYPETEETFMHSGSASQSLNKDERMHDLLYSHGVRSCQNIYDSKTSKTEPNPLCEWQSAMKANDLTRFESASQKLSIHQIVQSFEWDAHNSTFIEHALKGREKELQTLIKENEFNIPRTVYLLRLARIANHISSMELNDKIDAILTNYFKDKITYDTTEELCEIASSYRFLPHSWVSIPKTNDQVEKILKPEAKDILAVACMSQFSSVSLPVDFWSNFKNFEPDLRSLVYRRLPIPWSELEKNVKSEILTTIVSDLNNDFSSYGVQEVVRGIIYYPDAVFDDKQSMQRFCETLPTNSANDSIFYSADWVLTNCRLAAKTPDVKFLTIQRLIELENSTSRQHLLRLIDSFDRMWNIPLEDEDIRIISRSVFQTKGFEKNTGPDIGLTATLANFLTTYDLPLNRHRFDVVFDVISRESPKSISGFLGAIRLTKRTSIDSDIEYIANSVLPWLNQSNKLSKHPMAAWEIMRMIKYDHSNPKVLLNNKANLMAFITIATEHQNNYYEANLAEIILKLGLKDPAIAKTINVVSAKLKDQKQKQYLKNLIANPN